MSFINNIIEKRKEKINELNQNCDNLIGLICVAIDEANGYVRGSKDFVEVGVVDVWYSKHAELFNCSLKPFKKAVRFAELQQKHTELVTTSQQLRGAIERFNEYLANQKISSAYSLIGNVEGRKLDAQQMMCIVKEAHNHLIIAGAGTGKTTTVVGKIKYLLKSDKCKPSDILVLSFTNASAAEMKERICKETGSQIAATTFHKLGLNIIAKTDGIMPKITKLKMKQFISDQMAQLMESDEYVGMLANYLLYNKVVQKSEFDCKTQKEYSEYLELNPPTSMNNELLKSYGELDIANFLFQNGINYIYEAEYKVDTRTEEYAQYYPDFYLPDYDIYIEYFGVDKKGNVPDYFTGKDGLSASQAYQQSMEWKRNVHAENETILVECFAYEKFDGVMLDNLKKHLTNSGVEFNPMSAQNLWQTISSGEDKVLDGMIELFMTLINLLKSNNYSFEYFRGLVSQCQCFQSNVLLLNLLEPVFNAYEKYLAINREIDFNDMINRATEYVKSQRYIHPYKYVIVDEYQDISKARYSLLAEMRRTRDFSLFCVGDDWQSIYRFAGSDIGYILNFEKYWGPSQISRIETTYRFTKSLIEISGNFITQNPFQIKKQIVGKSADMRFSLGEINGYNDKYAVDFMVEKLNDLPKNSTVFFIGRYSFDVNLLNDNEALNCQYNNVSGLVEVSYTRRPDLKMSFMTAHKSKGLQAEYVFIINNKNTRLGFPSKIQDTPILSLLLENCEAFPFAEERRLFYVALTRAKVKAFMVTVNGKESVFAIELKNNYSVQLKKEAFECPLCGGKLLHKKGPYGEFFGCENYKIKGCKYKRRIRKSKNV